MMVDACFTAVSVNVLTTLELLSILSYENDLTFIYSSARLFAANDQRTKIFEYASAPPPFPPLHLLQPWLGKPCSLRARAVKRLAGIVDADASVMGRRAVKQAVTFSFLDEAVSVRQVNGIGGRESARVRFFVVAKVFFKRA